MAPTDLTKYNGQKVIVQVNLDKPNDKGETLVEIEGKAEAANELGILIKPKGRTQVELIEAAKIESVEFAPEPEKKIAVKTIAVIEYGKSRQHLADRHGLTLDEVNQLTEEQGLDYHGATDHTGLGHVHGEKEKPASQEAKAVEAEAAAEPAA